MTSAFIIEVGSQLQPDPNEETAALLRVLIHKVDNTTFGDDVPAVPQWAGPPRMIIQVQAILLASLAVSLFSAFLAMLGKQWLNRYVSVDIRGSLVERGRNRQRKLNGIVSWYFDHVMESLPLMLQVALLLHGCAVSRYFWEIDMTVAAVGIGVTSFALIFYIFIVIAGAVFVSCPYQTPLANIVKHTPDFFRRVLDSLRRIIHILRCIPDTPHSLSAFFILLILRIPGALLSALSALSAPAKRSICYYALSQVGDYLKAAPYPLVDTTISVLLVFLLPIWLAVDACRVVIWLLRWPLRRMCSRLQQRSEQQTATLDLDCISWTLRTSLDEPVRLSTLNYLATTTLVDPTLVVDCFDILFGYVKVTHGTVTIPRGFERLATASALCCLHTVSHLTAMYSTQEVLENIHLRYTRVFPFKVKFDDLPCSHTLGAIHRLFYPACIKDDAIISIGTRQSNVRMPSFWSQVRWEDYKPPSDEYVIVACALARIARFKHQRGGYEKVPRWLLRFALHSLSQSPLPPTSVIVACLSMVAIDLGRNPSITVTPDKKCVHICRIYAFLTKNQLATG